MSCTVVRIFLSAILFEIGIEFSEERKTRSHVSMNYGCADGRKQNLFHLKDVSACNGAWEGHVSVAPLCSNGWHVCNWNDTRQLSSITYYRAAHVNGCYAINAAQNGESCQECIGDRNHMAGVGADCPTLRNDLDSCLNSGTIIASHDLSGVANQSCSFAPWITGVVCCKDKPKGFPPVIKISPPSSVRVPIGSEITLKCSASGHPTPKIKWFKNGHPVVFDGLVDDVFKNGDVVVSSLRISPTSKEHDGLYVCRAKNRWGFVVSYSSDLTTYRTLPGLTACRNKTKQISIFGNAIAACAGKWRGSVKRASRQLCAKGWKVCGVKDRSLMYKLSWEDVTSLAGCYAYDAATSDNFACTRCSHRNKGNRMSGIGDQCGSFDLEAVSCLREGRVNVWDSRFAMTSRSRNRKPKSCGYMKGVTSGVVCCKTKKKDRRRKKVGRCSPPCGSNSYCSTRGVCKCNSKFKLLRGKCLPKNKRGTKCSGVNCLNGGRCEKGLCICPSFYFGTKCEKAIQRKSLQ